MNGTDATHDGRIDVNYADKTEAELERLRAHFMKLHQDAHDAYRADGRQNGSVWDEKMKDLMAEVRAIDDALYAIDQGDEDGDGAVVCAKGCGWEAPVNPDAFEDRVAMLSCPDCDGDAKLVRDGASDVDRGRGVATDGGEDVRGETLKDLYGEIDPAEVESQRDWDPALAPDDFGPETAPNGRSYFTAAWDGGVTDITRSAKNVYELEDGDPVVMIYVSNRGGAQVFEGELERADDRQIVVRDGDDVRTAHAADMDGREDAVKGTTGRHVGTMLELRATRDRELEASLKDAVDRQNNDDEDDGEDDGDEDGEVVTDGGDVETFTFDGDASDDEDADVFVSERFEDSWGTERAVLEGDTYDAKEAIKATEWENTHYKFDDGRKAWLIDADAVDELKESLADAGFTFDDASDEDAQGDAFDELLETAREGAHVSVTYYMKNREDADREDREDWQKTREGVVTDAIPVEQAIDDAARHATGEGRLYFEDSENGRSRTLKRDDRGRPSIYGGGYHPYMGALATVEISLTAGSSDEDDEDDAQGDDEDLVEIRPEDGSEELLEALTDADDEDGDSEDAQDEDAPEEGEHVLIRYDVTGGMDDARVRGSVKTADCDELEIDPDARRMKTATVDMGTGAVAVVKDGGSGTGMITLRGELNSIEPTDDAQDDEDAPELAADGGQAVDVDPDAVDEGDQVRVVYTGDYSGRERAHEGAVVVDPYLHRDTPAGAIDVCVRTSDEHSALREFVVRVREDGRVVGLDRGTSRHDHHMGTLESFEVLEDLEDEDEDDEPEVMTDGGRDVTGDRDIGDVDELGEGDEITVVYESVYGTTGNLQEVALTVDDEDEIYRTAVCATDDDGVRHRLEIDGGVVTEIAKDTAAGNPRRLGYVDAVDVELAGEAERFDVRFTDGGREESLLDSEHETREAAEERAATMNELASELVYYVERTTAAEVEARHQRVREARELIRRDDEDDEDADDVDRGRGVETDGGEDVGVTTEDVERAADVSPAVQYPILDVRRPRSLEGPIGRSAGGDTFEVRCTGVDLDELTDGCLTAYREFKVAKVITAGSRGPGVVATIRYTGADEDDGIDRGRGLATDGGEFVDELPEDHEPDEPAPAPFATDRTLQWIPLSGDAVQAQTPRDEDPTEGEQWVISSVTLEVRQ